jgi:hypothetical protein
MLVTDLNEYYSEEHDNFVVELYDWVEDGEPNSHILVTPFEHEWDHVLWFQLFVNEAKNEH